MSAPNFYDFQMEHARLAVLRALLAAAEHKANDSVLAMLMETLGLPVTRDQLRTQLGWLEQQGFIRIERPTASMIVARLREHGAEVAMGKSRVDGVARPAPGR